MGTPYIAEIKILSFNFAPQGWALCNGQFLPINQNQALFSLLGTTYGGNGQTTFALPDLRGKVPVHMGNGFTEGQVSGQAAHTLTLSEMPSHTHVLNASSTNTNNIVNPSGAFLSNSAPAEIYRSSAGNPAVLTTLPATIANVGGSQPHLNLQPYLVLNFAIALQGIFPSQN